jgi:uncharacterized protein (TIGR02145 family)
MTNKNQFLLLTVYICCLQSCNFDSNSSEKNQDELMEIQTNDEIITDIDGNKYETIKIGPSIWLGSNLKATRFSNGDKIPNIKDDETWKKNNGPSYCFFNNDLKHKDFGCLYNLYTIIDKRNICPKGWHVASKDEWQKWNLEKGKYTTFDIDDKLFNNKVLGWRRISDDVDYHIQGGNTNDPNYNSFFFENDGTCIYWTSTKYVDEDYDTENPNDTALRGDIYASGELGEYGWGYRKDGFPCRCVKDTL